MSPLRVSLDKARGGCSRLVGTAFFGVFLAAGLLFCGLLGREVLSVADTWTWPEVPCTVTASAVTRDGEHFGLDVTYRYHWEGIEHVGSTVEQGGYSTSDVSDAERLAERYASGAEANCRVDPDDPARSVLRRRPLWFAFMLLLPLVFVAVGAGGIFVVWRGKSPQSGELQALAPRAPRRRGAARGALLFLFGVFALVGAVATYFVLVRPLTRVVAARGWQETPCRILSSEVRSHSSDDGTTYSIEVLYQYEASGSTFRSNRYDFLGGSSSGYDAKARVVGELPVGSTSVCYVNPSDPHEAVLARGFRAIYLVGLLPLLFLVIGVGGLGAVLTGRLAPGAGSAARARAAALAGGPAGPEQASGPHGAPVELHAQASPAAKLAGTILFALFWNGITAVFVVQLVGDWRAGGTPVGDTLFLLPFVLIGLGAFGGIGYFALALANPRPTLHLPAGMPSLGERFEVEWTMSGRVERIDRLRITLTGREEATYRRGTNTHTDRETFAELTVFDSSDSWGMRRGRASVVVPADTMHSFTASNNKILWSLELRGEITRWPDVNEDFQVEVRPRAMGARP